jgi:putative salt-induced outer membrane protein YdiY
MERRRMRLRFGIALLGALTLTPAAARAQGDVLVLRNGDRITGTLVAADGATWTFRHAGGELKIPAGEVAEFTGSAPIGVRLADGTIAAGRITTTGDALRFTAADGTSRTLAATDLAAVGNPDDLAALRPIAIGFLSPIGKFWGATLGAGFANTSGNSRSRGFNGDLKVDRKTAKDRLAFGLGGATEWSALRDPGTGEFPDTLAKVAEKYFGSARLDVYASRAIYLFGGTTQEIDKFQGIDLRSNYAAGAGYQIIATDPTDLRFDLSAGLRVENFTPGAGDTTISTPVASAGGALRQQLGPMRLDWSLRWTPAVEDIKDYRLLSDAGLSTNLFQGVGFRIGSRNQLNNNPPAGIDKHDWLLTFNLTYSIGG